MSKRQKTRAASAAPTSTPPARAAWNIHFFKRHKDDDPIEHSPPGEFLENGGCPPKVQQTIYAVLKAVAEAPPPSFSGGGKWEAMHGSMQGYYEVRVDGPQRRHYRLFCMLERDGAVLGLDGPSIVAIAGASKAFLTVFTEADYGQIRALGEEYKRRTPRSVLR